MKLFYKAIAVLTALLIILPLTMVKAAADNINFSTDNVASRLLGIISTMGYSDTVLNFSGQGTYGDQDTLQLNFRTIYGNNNSSGHIRTINWNNAIANNYRISFEETIQSVDFNMTGGLADFFNFVMYNGTVNIQSGTVNYLYFNDFSGEAVINNATINSLRITNDSGDSRYVIGANTVITGSLEVPSGAAVDVEYGAQLPATITGEENLNYLPNPTPETSADTETTDEPSTSSKPSSKKETLNSFSYEINDPVKEQYIKPEIEIIDNEQFKKDGLTYYGTVDIKGVDSDTPQEIPSKVFIDGKRYAVGDVVYIVGTEEKKIEATADTGFSYVFTAVENSDKPVVFTAEGLPEGLEMTEDGVITTRVLPAPVGTFEITVTADNGADTNEYKMTIEIKEGGLSDEDLLAALTANDIPELLTEPQKSVPGLWTNDELSIHYEPEIEDFYALFLDGKLLTPETDYRVEEGSTVIILTEQTMIPLPQGDHVVTTMFHQNSDVGLDTVINDVGSSSFVFRFGDDKTSGKRVNIGGDGVTGSVTFDDTNAKEEPITAITANSEAIERRAANLSNATGREIIAAFETKQHGGFGGKTATFAISTKSLGLTLKDGTVVYVAVYDSTTGKTYQNKGEVKDGMIVFRTVHSGVFMVALEKF